jgi:hypothetical protein
MLSEGAWRIQYLCSRIPKCTAHQRSLRSEGASHKKSRLQKRKRLFLEIRRSEHFQE